MEVFSIIFALIWMFVVIRIIVKIASGASKQSQVQQQVRQNLQQMPKRLDAQSNAPKVYDAQQQNLDRMKQAQTFRSVPGSTYGSTNPARQTAFSAAKSDPFRAGTAVDVKTSSVLFEDRRNDWLAQQLREEARLKRTGSIYDLGAAHEVECAADDLKQTHIRRHNTNGINRRTFR